MFTKKFEELSKKDANIAGGKGASLGEMIRNNFSVPDGFVILAGTFDRFLELTDLNVEVRAVLNKVKKNDINSVEKASKKIRDLFDDTEFPKEIGKEIIKNHKKLGESLVAVRSSATAEDSEVASWAGELESYMNVTEKNLLESVRKCWVSLFTPRATFYRYEKKMEDQKVSVAVVIQKMIQSEVSGICFTVHPVTEDQNQMVIEAGFGLGDAIVGGMITPDSYVVRKSENTNPKSETNSKSQIQSTKNFIIEDINISEQKIMLVRSKTGHKKVGVQKRRQKKQKLTRKKIIELAKLCARIENHYQFPCDIEWAMEKDKLYITQSRPITTLQ